MPCRRFSSTRPTASPPGAWTAAAAGDLPAARAQLEAAADLGEQVGDLVTARAGYASALAAQNSTDLDKIANDFEHLGANLYAAEARAEAAVILRRAGKTREARAAEHNASRLLTRCEGAVTPAVQTVTARALLTPGELDAAVQAAAGRSNKQIAADMHVSVRTAESHLQRACEKLGISGRHALSDALRDQPTTAPSTS